MDAIRFRKALAEFIGEDRYRQLVRRLNSGERLRYWQEALWDEFVAARPEWSIGDREREEALRVCWVHGEDLQDETVATIEGLADYAGHAVRVGSERYPHAERTVILWSEGCPFPPRAAVLRYCRACRREYDEHHPSRGRAIDWTRLRGEGDDD